MMKSTSATIAKMMRMVHSMVQSLRSVLSTLAVMASPRVWRLALKDVGASLPREGVPGQERAHVHSDHSSGPTPVPDESSVPGPPLSPPRSATSWVARCTSATASSTSLRRRCKSSTVGRSAGSGRKHSSKSAASAGWSRWRSRRAGTAVRAAGRTPSPAPRTGRARWPRRTASRRVPIRRSPRTPPSARLLGRHVSGAKPLPTRPGGRAMLRSINVALPAWAITSAGRSRGGGSPRRAGGGGPGQLLARWARSADGSRRGRSR